MLAHLTRMLNVSFCDSLMSISVNLSVKMCFKRYLQNQRVYCQQTLQEQF